MTQHHDTIFRQVKNEPGSRCVKCLNRQTNLIEVTEHSNGVYNHFYCPNCGFSWCFKLRGVPKKKNIIDEIIKAPESNGKKSVVELYHAVTDGGLSHDAAMLFRVAHREIFKTEQQTPEKRYFVCRSCNHTFGIVDRGNTWVECPMCRKKIRAGDEQW